MHVHTHTHAHAHAHNNSGMLGVFGEKTNVWAVVGQLTLAVPELVLAISAVIYGVALVRMIKDSMARFTGPETLQKKQLIACKKTSVLFVVFSGTFLLQATIDAIAGVAPDVYYTEVAPLVASLDLMHAFCSVMVNVIIIRSYLSSDHHY